MAVQKVDAKRSIEKEALEEKIAEFLSGLKLKVREPVSVAALAEIVLDNTVDEV